MSTKSQRPPAGRPWAWITLELVESDAWRSMSINTFKFINFLWREHMRHGGAENGKLKAPQHQLQAYGIGARYITDTIAQADQLGLVDCERHGERTASTYALTRLPTCDGRDPSNRWRTYRNPRLSSLPVPKTRNLPLKGKVGLPLKGKADSSNLPLNGKADDPKNLPLKGKDLSRCSYQDSSYSTVVSGDEAGRGHAPELVSDTPDHALADGLEHEGEVTA